MPKDKFALPENSLPPGDESENRKLSRQCCAMCPSYKFDAYSCGHSVCGLQPKRVHVVLHSMVERERTESRNPFAGMHSVLLETCNRECK